MRQRDGLRFLHMGIPGHDRVQVLLGNIQQGGELVTKDCYKFVDEDERMVGYYDSKGILIDSRPATPEELGGNLFRQTRVGAGSEAGKEAYAS